MKSMNSREFASARVDPRSGRVAALSAALLAAAVYAARQPSPSILPSAGAASRAETTHRARDLSAVMRRVHVGFRQDGSVFRGGHDTYVIESQDGRVRLTPHHPATTSTAAPRRTTPTEGASLALETVSVARTRGSNLLREVVTRIDDEGRLEIDRGSVVETWSNSEQGSEQAWRLAMRPSGSGDLVVEVETRGLTLAGSTSGGLHFADTSGLGFRYGHATFIDANGRRTPVTSEYRDGRVVLRVPSAAVEQASYPAVLDPVVGPEFGMDQPVLGSAPHLQTGSSIASDGTNRFVVWSDWRGDSAKIFGTRVDASDTVLDPNGILLADYGSYQFAPAVVFDGTNYLVAWYGNGYTRPRIEGTRVSTAGVVLDAAGIDFAPGLDLGTLTGPVVASNGSESLVAWFTMSVTSSLVLVTSRVDVSGTAHDTLVSPITTPNWTIQSPAMATDGTNYVITWFQGTETGYDILGIRLASDGSPLDANPIHITSGVSSPGGLDIAFDGTNYLLVWSDLGGEADIYGTRISRAGAVLDGAGISISSANGYQTSPTVAYGGSLYVVAWNYGGDIYGARITKGGIVLDGAGVQVTSDIGEEGAPSVAFVGGGFYMTWDDDRTGGGDIYGARVNGALGMLDRPGILLSSGPNEELEATVAHGTGQYLVVWRDTRSGDADVYGVRISEGGDVLDDDALTIGTGPDNQELPHVVFDGTNYLVLWIHGHGSVRELRANRVSLDGSILDGTGFRVGGTNPLHTRIAAAFDGNNYLVVWVESMVEGEAPPPGTLLGARISRAGAVLDTTPIVISPGGGAGGNFGSVFPTIAFDGTNYLVVFGALAVVGHRVSTAGVVLDDPAFAITTELHSLESWSSRPSVAFDGTNYLVIWKGRRNQIVGTYGRRVSTQGILLDTAEIVIATAPSTQSSPTLGFDGANYVAMWADPSTGNEDIRAVRIAPSGSVEDGCSWDIADSSEPESRPSLAMIGPETGLVVYDALHPDSSGVRRVYARRLSAGAGGTTDDDCDGHDDDCDGLVDEDADCMADAGVIDSGVTDAGGTDAGVTSGKAGGGGCACSLVATKAHIDGTGPMLLGTFIALAAWARRRLARARRSTSSGARRGRARLHRSIGARPGGRRLVRGRPRSREAARSRRARTNLREAPAFVPGRRRAEVNRRCGAAAER